MRSVRAGMRRRLKPVSSVYLRERDLPRLRAALHVFLAALVLVLFRVVALRKTARQRVMSVEVGQCVTHTQQQI